MRTPSRILLLTAAASLSLTASGFSQEAEKETPKKSAPPAESVAPAPKADEKPRAKAPDAKAPSSREEHAGAGRPDMEKMREQMQGRMQEIQKLREAGKSEEAEKLMVELKKHAEEIRAKFGEHGPGPRRPDAEGGPARGPGGPDGQARGEEPQRGPQRPSAEGDRPTDRKPDAPKADEKPRPQSEVADRSREGHGRPDLSKLPEPMRDKIQEIRKLREAGKGEEAEKLMAELKKHAGEMLEQMVRQGHGPDGQARGEETQRGPHRPSAEGGRPSDRKPDAPKAEDKPRPQPEVAEGRQERGGRDGGDRPDMAKVHEQIQARMEEAKKLKAAGNHEAAEKVMADIKKHAGELRERMAQQGHRGPDANAQRGPQRPPHAGRDGGDRDQKGPQPPRLGDRQGGPQPGGQPNQRPDMSQVREHMQARVQEIRKLHQSGKHEEAAKEIAEIKKHVGEMRAHFGRSDDQQRRGQQHARPQGRSDQQQAGQKRHEGRRDHAKKPSRDFQPRAGARKDGPKPHAGRDRDHRGQGRDQRGPGGFQGRGHQGPSQGGRPPAPMMGRGGFGAAGPSQAWGGGRPGSFHPGFQRGR